ncbi:MAG: hypothetical protein QOK05_2641 [Chloroflexota bacterium]|jgi:membrane-associated phospholipid phosphatase|nr:hypothetical protein [Chloroflexota bacterium]
MDRLRQELRQGIFGQGVRNAAVAIGMAVLVYVSSKGYDALNHGPYRVFLRTPLDEAMPLVKVFVIPYVSLQPVIYATLVFFLLFRMRLYQSTALALVGTFVIAYVFFFFLQSYVARPHVTETDWLSKMVSEVYTSDNPYNDFPSLHVATSTVIAIHWWRCGRTAGWIAAAWAVVVIASTQLIHQHYLVDIPGGLAAAFGASWLTLHYLDGVVKAGASPGVASGPGGDDP